MWCAWKFPLGTLLAAGVLLNFVSVLSAADEEESDEAKKSELIYVHVSGIT